MFNPTKRKQVLNPEKELRFTRSHQAIIAAMIAAVLAASAIIILSIAIYTQLNKLPPPIHPIWCFIPAILTIPFGWATLYLASHAYILLTPLGIEIFPLWKPSTNFRIVHWSEIGQITFDETRNLMVIDFKNSDGGVILTLAPIRKKARTLLRTAVLGRMKKTSPTAKD